MNTIKTKIIEHLLKCNAFDEDNDYDKVSGIARLASTRGYDLLSDRQKYVLKPYLERVCDGIEDPGGYHNNCKTPLTGEELLAAYKNKFSSDEPVLCEECREMASFYEYQYNKLMDE